MSCISSKICKQLKQFINYMIALIPIPAFARTVTYSIGTSTNSGFQLIVNFWQDYVNFMIGPFASVAVVGALTLAIGAWMFLPKDGVMGWIIRIIVGAIAILNIVTWITVFGG